MKFFCRVSQFREGRGRPNRVLNSIFPFSKVSCHLSAAFKGDGDECPSNDFIDHLIDMSHLLLAINSSANFVIYTWRGERRKLSLLSVGLRNFGQKGVNDPRATCPKAGVCSPPALHHTLHSALRLGPRGQNQT